MALGRDLQPGDLISSGLVIGVDLVGDNEVWEGTPNITYLCLDAPFYGPIKGELFLDQDYVIFHRRGTSEYNTVLARIANTLYDHVKVHVKCIQQLNSYIYNLKDE